MRIGSRPKIVGVHRHSRYNWQWKRAQRTLIVMSLTKTRHRSEVTYGRKSPMSLCRMQKDPTIDSLSHWVRSDTSQCGFPSVLLSFLYRVFHATPSKSLERKVSRSVKHPIVNLSEIHKQLYLDSYQNRNFFFFFSLKKKCCGRGIYTWI